MLYDIHLDPINYGYALKSETGNERKLKTCFVIFATVYIIIFLRSSFFLPNEKIDLFVLFCSEYHVMKYATTNDCFSINF